ncbi:aminopeptidase N [Congregibacter variabilis]|uniref:Aminopeptidase N n=1 Tax=Congregibacter variabilis TaxID=3081200 RepID=A0ABZ0I4D1_9GAMM|nr:aminopeptidase N [Congregibacter sp. IMCC43200]
MRDAQPKTIFLSEYKAPDYGISYTELHFELFDDHSLVHARLHFKRSDHASDTATLVLNGQELELQALALDGETLASDDYELSDDFLCVSGLPASGVLETTARIYPQSNTSLEGLYRSRGLFCTQCEAEGFRKITWFPDRPDVMSTYHVTVDADARQCPELLSNGNLVQSMELPGDRHRAVWDDPFPKPSYLFALVAGNLSRVEDTFITMNGRKVRLIILVEEKDLDKCAHAMDSLKRSMRWDEERFGREYDLDVFHIVAVDDFNMGAMENKSLNIFNTSCVLAAPDTTTDAGYQRIESIVAHEYFHNWSGNRVTCRDWFQLSLKEGFTVFRDAEFSADMGSRSLKRVEDAMVMRTLQFAEDAGPMSHPVRPASFIEISNFYTLTVYEKGAEVVRMLHTLLGEEDFRRGSDLYFDRHDGQAVTCDDFVSAMEDASGKNLSDFKRWYSQAGTPELTIRDDWDAEQGVYTLSVSQETPATPGQSDKEALVIPLAMGLLGEAGNLRLTLDGEAPDPESADNTHRILIVDKPEQEFRFSGLPECPTPSLLRGFSAPVRVDYPYTREQLLALVSRDDDEFVRWDSLQQLMVSALQELQAEPHRVSLDPLLEEAVNAICSQSLDPAVQADMLRLPSETYLAELASHSGKADVHGIFRARQALRQALAETFRERWQQLFDSYRVTAPYAAIGEQIGARALANVALDYLATGDEQGVSLAAQYYFSADNLTNRLVALRTVLREGDAALGDSLIDDFYARFKDETLAMNHWLSVQAENTSGDSIARVRALMEHPAYDSRNPNKIRALIGAFANANAVHFHKHDGAGYRLLGEVVETLNEQNPQIASRLLTPLTRWNNYAQGATLMRAELERLSELPSLSPDVYEVLSKSLA